jgi:dolichyl-phosphate beta-glucosyltransferase
MKVDNIQESVDNSNHFISVVIPAFNEELRIAGTIQSVHDYLQKRYARYEIVVVDDGSTDATRAVVAASAKERNYIRLIRHAVNSGKGFAVKSGIFAASGNIIIMCDADLSTPIEESEKLLSYYEEGFDLVIGSRGLKESDIVVRQPWYRGRMGKIFNLLVRLLVIGDFRDTQCGFKMFRRDAARELFSRCRMNHFCFDVEILFMAKKHGFRIKEVPIRWINSPDSKVKVFKDSLRMLIDLVIIRVNSYRGFYSD